MPLSRTPSGTKFLCAPLPSEPCSPTVRPSAYIVCRCRCAELRLPDPCPGNILASSRKRHICVNGYGVNCRFRCREEAQQGVISRLLCSPPRSRTFRRIGAERFRGCSDFFAGVAGGRRQNRKCGERSRATSGMWRTAGTPVRISCSDPRLRGDDKTIAAKKQSVQRRSPLARG